MDIEFGHQNLRGKSEVLLMQKPFDVLVIWMCGTELLLHSSLTGPEVSELKQDICEINIYMFGGLIVILLQIMASSW